MEELNKLDLEAAAHGEHDNAWGIDKKIPVALILVVIFQTVAITWGAATLSSDVRNGLVKIDKLEENLEKFVEKSDLKFATRAAVDDFIDDERREIDYIKDEIQRLDARVRDLEKNLN
jgi:peptidoglycan hydrolase CwlO-like protein